MKLTNLFGKILLACMLLSCNAGFAQTAKPQGAAAQNGPNEKVIRAYYTAFEKKNWNSMQQILADGFTFCSPLDDHISVKAFKEKCWPNAYKIKRFDIEKLMVDGDDAFVTYNGWTTDGRLFRNTEYFKFEGGKIKENACFFGPGVNYPNNTAK